MSDDVLKLIPTDPRYVPSEEAQQLAVAALEQLLPDGEMCEAETYDGITFVDQGQNISAVLCPACSKRLDFHEGDDAVSDWWGTVTETSDDEELSTLIVQMPCCRASVPFTSLRFDWPAGFATFELSIWNPNVPDNLSADEVAQLEKILGCSLIQVRAHY
jgi:hypothetical protein